MSPGPALRKFTAVVMSVLLCSGLSVFDHTLAGMKKPGCPGFFDHTFSDVISM